MSGLACVVAALRLNAQSKALATLDGALKRSAAVLRAWDLSVDMASPVEQGLSVCTGATRCAGFQHQTVFANSMDAMAANIRTRAAGLAECTCMRGGTKPCSRIASSIHNSTS